LSREISQISLHSDPLAAPGGPHYGEQNVYVKELSRYLGAFGLKIDVYSRRENDQQPIQEVYSRGTRVIRIPIGPPEEIQEERIIPLLKDIAAWIPSHQIQQGLRYSLVHSHYYLSGVVGIHMKDTWGIPLVHNFHSLGVIQDEILGSGNHKSETRQKIERLICARADRIIATSSQEKTDLIELYQADPEVISIIPCGVNLELFQPLPQSESRADIAFPIDTFLITYVGQLEEVKGLDTLLKAIQLVDNPEIQAVIVGGPPSDKPFLSRAELSREPFQKYIALVDEYGLEKQITFTGGKPRDQLSKYYSAGDITVVPSLYEPIGLTAIEALACGSSVIASRVGGLKSTVQENRVGALFNPRNAEQLAEKIKLIYDQPMINKELRKNARPYAEENFNWKSTARSVGRVYQELIEESDTQS
jgi:D-inositol-3-phosphate glycosyltransferase